jgi:hypothetical protein
MSSGRYRVYMYPPEIPNERVSLHESAAICEKTCLLGGGGAVPTAASNAATRPASGDGGDACVAVGRIGADQAPRAAGASQPSTRPQLWTRVKVVPHLSGSANSASASRRSEASSSSLSVSSRRDSSATLN